MWLVALLCAISSCPPLSRQQSGAVCCLLARPQLSEPQPFRTCLLRVDPFEALALLGVGARLLAVLAVGQLAILGSAPACTPGSELCCLEV